MKTGMVRDSSEKGECPENGSLVIRRVKVRYFTPTSKQVSWRGTFSFGKRKFFSETTQPNRSYWQEAGS